MTLSTASSRLQSGLSARSCSFKCIQDGVANTLCSLKRMVRLISKDRVSTKKLRMSPVRHASGPRMSRSLEVPYTACLIHPAPVGSHMSYRRVIINCWPAHAWPTYLEQAQQEGGGQQRRALLGSQIFETHTQGLSRLLVRLKSVLRDLLLSRSAQLCSVQGSQSDNGSGQRCRRAQISL